MKTIASYNIKGGVGKTATAVNLSWIAWSQGYRTLIWDLDPQAAATYYFRISPKVRKGAKKLVRGRRELDELIRGTDYPGLDLVPSDFSYRKLDLHLDRFAGSTTRLSALLAPLAEDYDLIILDCPPSLSVLSENVFHAADALLVPVIPSPLSIRALEQIQGHFQTHRGSESVLKYAFYSMVDARKSIHKRVCESQQIPGFVILSAAIPYSSQVEKMGLHRAPLGEFAGSSRPMEAYLQLWHEVRTGIDLGPGARPRLGVW